MICKMSPHKNNSSFLQVTTSPQATATATANNAESVSDRTPEGAPSSPNSWANDETDDEGEKIVGVDIGAKQNHNIEPTEMVSDLKSCLVSLYTIRLTFGT